jgi:hypothetical protein
MGGFGGTGGDGIKNSGTITTLINRGTISGGPAGPRSGVRGDAIYSAGDGASIGTISNTGSIVGNVEIDDQSNVTIINPSKKYGSWTGGTIDIGNGNLTFGGGAALTRSFIGDNITVDAAPEPSSTRVGCSLRRRLLPSLATMTRQPRPA